MSSKYISTSEPKIKQVETSVQESTIDDQRVWRVRVCFQQNHSQLVRWLEVRTGSMATACDIANEAFATVLEFKGQVADLRAYVYRIAANILARRGETDAIHRRLDVRIANGPDSFSPSPEPGVAEEQEFLALRAAIGSLPPRAREAIRLRYWEELSYDEILHRFRERGVVVHLRTVMRWVAYGLEKCRDAMEAKERLR